MSTCSNTFSDSMRMMAKPFEYPTVAGAAATPAPMPIDLGSIPAPEPEIVVPPVPGITEADLAAAHEKGRREGRNEAERQYREQFTKLAEQQRVQIAEEVAKFQESNTEYFGKIESQVVHLAMSIAAKILHRESQVDPMLVAALVRIAVQNLKQGSRVEVKVRPEDVASWRTYFEQDSNGHVTVEIVEDAALSAGDCIVTSEVGTADLGIAAQLKEIERGLFDLLAQRPKHG